MSENPTGNVNPTNAGANPGTNPGAGVDDGPYWTAPRIGLGALLALVILVPVTIYAVHTMRERQRLAELSMGPHALTQAQYAQLGEQFNTKNLTLPATEIFAITQDEGQLRTLKDVIPSLKNPPAVKVGEAKFMDPKYQVVGVTINGASRAYSINVLTWHEIINDELGGVPIAVLYSPLCDSVSVVDRRLGEKTYDLGGTGLLCNSNMLFYDNVDNGLWSQLGMSAVSGPQVGKFFPAINSWVITTWPQWQERYPDSTVSSFVTGHMRMYNTNQYRDYYRVDELMYPVEGLDTRGAPNKTTVVGLRMGPVAKAYPLANILNAEGGILHDTILGKEVQLRAVRESKTVEVLAAPAEATLVNSFWFAWAAFYPDTDVYKVPSASAPAPGSNPTAAPGGVPGSSPAAGGTPGGAEKAPVSEKAPAAPAPKAKPGDAPKGEGTPAK